MVPRSSAPAATPGPPTPIASKLTLAEWRKADNNDRCAPLAITNDGGAKADVRAAYFGGGWAVAFDQPQQRSLYGVAGTGVTLGGFDAEVERLRKQWPYHRDLGSKAGGLPAGAFAGYGVEGGGTYPPGNPHGAGTHSLAYVVIPGQGCLYNVWSKVSRAHLETLLDGLTILPTD